MNPPYENEKIQEMTPGKVPVGLVGFLRHPNENLKADYRPGGLLRTVCWWAGVQVFFAIAMALLITFDLGQGGAEDTTRASMPPEGVSAKAFLWLLIFLPPVLEEFLFRYPLRRTRWVLTLWSTVVAYLLVSALAGCTGIEAQGLLWRLALGGAVGLAVGLGGWRYALKINFGGAVLLLGGGICPAALVQPAWGGLSVDLPAVPAGLHAGQICFGTGVRVRTDAARIRGGRCPACVLQPVFRHIVRYPDCGRCPLPEKDFASPSALRWALLIFP